MSEIESPATSLPIQVVVPPPIQVEMPTNLQHISADSSRTRNIKIENCIGFTQVPVGLAGPLTIHGENQKNTVFAPLATVEATLVASCSRGCKALQLCGGVQAAALSETMSRAPMFHFMKISDAVAFYKRVPGLESSFRIDAEKTSRHAKLLRVTPHIVGSSVHVKFDYSCGDATGQNMTTIATHAACEAFLKSPAARELKITGFNIEGQMASDKKLSWGNIKDGRGVQVLAWATLKDEVYRKVLGVDTESLHRNYLAGEQGSIRNGNLGTNINAANIMAAMFMACGQDVASVFEAGFAHLTTNYDPVTRDLTLSMFFPCMPVGTIGGGTGYATQKEALEIVGCYGQGKKWALAETVASFALALDISTMAAVGNDTFARSHKKFARAIL